MSHAVAILAAATCLVAVQPGPLATASPAAGRGSGPTLAALAPAPGPTNGADDARRAIAIGGGGELYEPDGNGAWSHRRSLSTASTITAAGRAGGAVIAIGDGVLYRLAGNGWSAIRLVQHGKAILGEGTRALAAVGRQLFALDALTLGEPVRIAQAAAPIIAIGAGPTAAVVATDTGLFRLAGARLAPLRLTVSLDHPRLITDRWAIVAGGAVDLATGRLTPWPAGLAIASASPGPGGALAAVATGPAGLELVTVAAGKLARDPLGITGTPVGVIVDRAGRAAVALSDGRIAVRGPTGWTVTTVTDAPAPDHPGPAPAASG